MKNFLFIFILIFLFHIQVYSSTYYVDFENGNDFSSGTAPENAWKHVPGDPQAEGIPLNVLLKSGDTCLFKGGVHYRGTFIIKSSGTAESPIIFKGDGWGNKRAVIDGSEPLKGWKKCTSPEDCLGNPNWKNIYYTSIPQGAKALTANLYQDNKILYISQEPNLPDKFFLDDLDNYIKIPSTNVTKTSIIDTRFKKLGGIQLIGAYVFVHRQQNEVDIRKITDFDVSKNKIIFEELESNPYPDSTKYSIANSISGSMLDGPGEYYVDENAGKIFLIPLDNKDPNQYEITVSIRDVTVDINGENHIIIEGFRFQKGIGNYHDGSIRTKKPCSYITIRNNEILMYRSKEISNSIYLLNSSNCLAENNYLNLNARMRGIVFSGQDMNIKNNRIKKVGRTPIFFVGVKNGEISDNIIEDCTGVHSNGISVYQGSENVLVTRNKVFNSNIALTLQSSDGIEIVNNILDGSGNAPIAFWNGTPDMAVKNVNIFHNLLIGSNNHNSIFSHKPVENMVVKNNIIDGVLDRTGNKDKITGIFSHNIYINHASGQKNLEDGEIIELDLSKIFVDYKNKDYNLKKGSPAIDAGTDAGVKEDINKNLRPNGKNYDIGPYEYR